MPGRVAKIEGVTRALEQGSLKLRVRDPASERALRRSSIMQVGPSVVVTYRVLFGALGPVSDRCKAIALGWSSLYSQVKGMGDRGGGAMRHRVKTG